MSGRVVVFGGYGVFGTHVARALASRGIPVRIAGRDGDKARAAAAALGTSHDSVSADLSDSASLRKALERCAVAANCAGPFQGMSHALLYTCLDARVHYTDIADDRGYLAGVRSKSAAFLERDLTAAWGCSSLPGVSEALARHLLDSTTDRPQAARVTLFIGNKNPKGEAAIRSAVHSLGRPFESPAGVVRGFRHGETVALPAPFGRRTVYEFDSPDLDVLPSLLGTKNIRVKVGFELRLATAGFAALAHLGPHFGDRTARFFAALGRVAGFTGHSGGAVMVELFFADRVASAALSSPNDGQLLAALPCAFAAEELATGGKVLRGAATAAQLLGAQALLERLMSSGGFSLTRS